MIAFGNNLLLKKKYTGMPYLHESVGETASGTSRIVTYPSNIEPGDLLMFYRFTQGDYSIAYPPSGSPWQLLGYVSSSYITLRMYYKFADGSEPSSETWQMGSSSCSGLKVMCQYKNVKSVDLSEEYAYSGYSNNFSLSSVTTDVPNTLVFAIVGGWNMANVSFRFGDRNWYSTQVVPYYAYPHYSDIMVFHNEMFEAGICPSDVVDSSTRNFGLIRQVKLIG